MGSGGVIFGAGFLRLDIRCSVPAPELWPSYRLHWRNGHGARPEGWQAVLWCMTKAVDRRLSSGWLMYLKSAKRFQIGSVECRWAGSL
jgi:hypothetical protein